MRDLVFAPENDFVYLLDIDDDYRDVFILFPNDLDKEYISEETAFYSLDFPEKYQYLKEKFEEKETV